MTVRSEFKEIRKWMVGWIRSVEENITKTPLNWTTVMAESIHVNQDYVCSI
jgi:hypothetical protein